MFSKNFVNHHKKLLHILKLKMYMWKFKVLKSVYIFEYTNRFIYKHIHIDVWF